MANLCGTSGARENAVGALGGLGEHQEAVLHLEAARLLPGHSSGVALWIVVKLSTVPAFV